MELRYKVSPKVSSKKLSGLVYPTDGTGLIPGDTFRDTSVGLVERRTSDADPTER